MNSAKNNIYFIKALFAFIFVMIGQSALAVGPYTYSANGSEVTDTVNGLIWRRCSEGQTWSGTICSGTPATYTHEGALNQAKNQLSWRLPNVKELSSLVDATQINPSIDSMAFPSTPVSFYWSSSPAASNASYAWFVDFSNGSVYGHFRSSGHYVRLVRNSVSGASASFSGP